MTHEPKNLIKVGFIALGCPKNVIDSEKMLARIATADFVLTSRPQDADVIVVNTCAFIEPARAEAFEAITQAVSWKKTAHVRKVVVVGCLAQQMGRALFEQVDGIDGVVDLSRRDDIAALIRDCLNSAEPISFLGGDFDKLSDDRVRLRIGPAHWAYLRISEGCSHRCSFCTIPAIRGPFRSKAIEQILAEAQELVEAGAVELNLIGQDTASYGRDLGLEDGLAELLTELEKLQRIQWIRLMYLYPAHVTDGLIETIASSEKVVHYLDIPIQHINDQILKKMRRAGSKERICKLIEHLRGAIPDIVLRTTLIVGFPGETDEHFAELLEFVEGARFDALGCFKYYAEKDTAAAEMPGQMPEQLKDQRVEQLMLTQQRIAFQKNQQRLGTQLQILLDSVEPNGAARGRFYGQAPEIDSVCLVADCSASAGQFVPVRVVGTKDYDLLVEQI